MRRVLWIVVLCAVGCAGNRVIDRAADGRPILICGPQPAEHTLDRLDKQYGIKTVVNLRGPSPGEAWFRRECRGVDSIGARLVHLKTSSHSVPTPEHLGRFFDIVENPDNWPVLVHCQSGIHRTGLLCALYRIQYQGWTGERAHREMLQNGFRLGKGNRDHVEEFVKTYAPDPARKLRR